MAVPAYSGLAFSFTGVCRLFGLCLDIGTNIQNNVCTALIPSNTSGPVVACVKQLRVERKAASFAHLWSGFCLRSEFPYFYSAQKKVQRKSSSNLGLARSLDAVFQTTSTPYLCCENCVARFSVRVDEHVKVAPGSDNFC